jgi:L-cysteate sulfo-lyase
MQLARFPRLRFAHLPTPLEPLENLSKHLGVRTLIKRDDCTGLSTGGNKTRKLEFLAADALDKKADTLLTQGAVQSNHARQTAAIAARLGMRCEILLEDRTGNHAPDYMHSGNVFLDLLHGASIARFPAGTDMSQALDEAAANVRARGGRPYIIPGGGSTPIGALGYVNCALELVHQATAMGLAIDTVVTATGSGGTQGGLVAGLEILRSGIGVLGIGVRVPRQQQEDSVFALATKTADLLGHPGAVARSAVVANCDYVGQGYGLPTSGMVEAVEMLARLEGILIDPVYTGKGMAGLIDLARKGQFKDKTIVFLHTGGSAGLFGYTGAFDFGAAA